MPVCCTRDTCLHSEHDSPFHCPGFDISSIETVKFSLHFTNNIVPELSKRTSFEVRKKNVDLVFIYREVFYRQ